MAATATTLTAAAATDVGRIRDVNEDRFHADPGRGIFIVVDGMGGQAAGGRAADTALQALRQRLHRETGTVADRIREAITIANNEVHRQASERAEFHGMACVLTVAVVAGGRAVVGHVGDTRLYKLRADRIEKITADHSPVGEREDAQELSELEAMRHPRRNEVYRDVGSEPWASGDASAIELREIPFEDDAALLLCSDGLTDLVPSETIRQIVARHAGDPQTAVRALVDAANAAGGKDNVTAVVVEGPAFGGRAPVAQPSSWRVARQLAVAVTLTAIGFAGVAWWRAGWPFPPALAAVLNPPAARVVVVSAGESIAKALEAAAPGTTVLVEPGEYSEVLRLKDHVRLESRVPHRAILRVPGTAAEDEVAVRAEGVVNTALTGFRIVGDAATPLGTGVLVRHAEIRIWDVQIVGARIAALDLGPSQAIHVAASDIRDNPGLGLIVRPGSTARIVHNTFSRNGSSSPGSPSILLEPGAQPSFLQNVMLGIDAKTLEGAGRAEIASQNFFLPPRQSQPPAASGSRGRSGQ